MLVIWGTGRYGKVDRCPGLFHVVTSFAHFWLVPLAPIRSYVVTHGGESVKIELSWKSVLFAYLRTALILFGTIAVLFVPPFVWACVIRPDTLAVTLAVTSALVTIGCWLGFFLSYRFSRPSPERAVRLAERAGIDPRIVAEHFLNRGVRFEPGDGHDALADTEEKPKRITLETRKD
jgi:hypothetical protein